ncbi:MAG: SPOR domain-containing protein [Desulfuromonadales bacterium]|nr:SPOR domain-containing protein [Desulfuromonadales bacterium]
MPAPDPPQRLAYYLQVGAYHDRNGAEALAARLESEGFKVVIRRKGAFHRLLAGPEHSPTGIDEVARRLAETVDPGHLDRPSAWMTLGPVQGSEL